MITKNYELLKIEIRSYLLKAIAENDPNRFRTRTLQPKRGKGHKNRPRNSNRKRREIGE